MTASDLRWPGLGVPLLTVLAASAPASLSLLTLGDEASPPEPGSLMLHDREGGVADSVLLP